MQHGPCSPVWVMVLVFGFSTLGHAFVAQNETSYPKDFLYDAAKRLILTTSSSVSEEKSPISLEDRSAGLIRFTFRDGGYSDAQATVELIEMDSGHSKIRVELHADYSGRTQSFLDKILAQAKKISEGNAGKNISYSSREVYPTLLRYVLKKFVKPGQKKEDVIKMAEQDVGILRFVYTEGRFKDVNTVVEVISVQEGVSRLVVTVPSDLTHGILLQQELLRVLQEDLKEAVEPTPEPEKL